VEVRDDGRGFAPESISATSGLVHMEDRARSFGGHLEIRAEPGGGTSIVAWFPVITLDDHLAPSTNGKDQAPTSWAPNGARAPDDEGVSAP
jgi:signal transduction histidine kinase